MNVSPSFPRPSTISRYVRILVVRACAIGDFVLNLPALQALSAACPGAAFTLVGYPATLQLARTFIPVEAIHSIELPPWSRLFVEPVPGLDFDAAWVWMKETSVAENIRKSGIADVFRADPFSFTSHAAEHLLRSVHLPAPELPDLWDSREDRIILHPGSGSPGKVWPGFAEMARRLPEAVILVGPCESDFAARNSRIENLSLADAAEELRHCRRFVGNDSGMTHIAAYWGTPTIALFGPTDPRIWGPWGRRVRVLQKPSLADISVKEVMELL